MLEITAVGSRINQALGNASLSAPSPIHGTANSKHSRIFFACFKPTLILASDASSAAALNFHGVIRAHTIPGVIPSTGK